MVTHLFQHSTKDEKNAQILPYIFVFNHMRTTSERGRLCLNYFDTYMIHLSTCARTHTQTDARTHVHTHTHAHTHTHTHIQPHTQPHNHCVYRHAGTHARTANAHPHIPFHMCAHIHSHTSTR